MGISQAVAELLSRAKPSTLIAVIAILAAGFGSTVTMAAQGWWLSTHGYSYAVSEAKRYSDMADDVTELKRWRRAMDEERLNDRNERAADRTLVWDLKGDMREIKGQLNILLRRTR